MRPRYMDRAQPFSIGTSPSNLGGCRWQPWFQTPQRIRKYRNVHLFGIIELFQKGRKTPIECNPTWLIWAPLLWNCNGGTASGSHGLARSSMTQSVELRSGHDLVIPSLYSQTLSVSHTLDVDEFTNFDCRWLCLTQCDNNIFQQCRHILNVWKQNSSQALKPLQQQAKRRLSEWEHHSTHRTTPGSSTWQIIWGLQQHKYWISMNFLAWSLSLRSQITALW